MNVYDFDKTIYRSDSTKDFILKCFLWHPKALLYVPRFGFAAMKYYLFHIGNKTQFKERMYSLFKACDGEKDVARFWSEKLSGIKPFYCAQHRDDDVIISASPEFLLKPLEQKLHITVIAYKVDIRTGKYDGVNCYHAEKVKRFYECFPNGTIEEFYSDSYSDEPLANLAERAFIVKDDQLIEWDHQIHKKNLRT